MVAVTRELSEEVALSSGTFENSRDRRRYGRWDRSRRASLLLASTVTVEAAASTLRTRSRLMPTAERRTMFCLSAANPDAETVTP